jgi:hypothetical protein
MISWLLGSWIEYIVHAALLLGVFGTFFGYVILRTPIIWKYAIPIKLISIPLLILAIFAEGYLYASKSWIEETKKFEEKVKLAEEEAKDANDKLGKALEEKNKSIVQQRVVIQERIKEVQVKVNEECKISPEVVTILNDAAKLK